MVGSDDVRAATLETLRLVAQSEVLLSELHSNQVDLEALLEDLMRNVVTPKENGSNES